ncbi:hypothetical protein Lfu02_31500 [Longispora fulva]|uniref:Transcriptional regulator with XRE-family HTH domain n=1 Tax=Longispora fulva TaxID=619741 RepID=A0A8J7GHK3_9ACTN|nr:hypothetical protein [Longispora fulva]MBG6139284.1 transcriptional regulator with XRE-family HTH domain [Longispora fulva]GIG58778.1 hypothetical protein Lfu02_31500 [Longispora fulva]
MGDWQAVADAINARMGDLPIQQNELAARSGVSVATIRELQGGGPGRRRSARTMSAISTALDWPEDHLARVLAGTNSSGGGRSSATSAPNDMSAVLAKLDELQVEVRELSRKLDRLASDQS